MKASRRVGLVLFAVVAGLTISSAGAASQSAPSASALEHTYSKAKAGDTAAIESLRTEATAGNKNAQLMVGNLFFGGTGMARDYKEAHLWYVRAAEQGVAEAQYNLGQLYRNGHGVAADFKTAADWYRKAADQDNPGAMYNLGGMYLEGRGVPQSDSEARKLFQRAAALGHRGAQRVLKQIG